MPGEPILIVDDTPVNLKLTRILLVNEGYKVMTAASAEEALELLRSYHPRLVLADIQLPGMDGFELTRHLKSDSRTQDIVVVALTAFAMKGDEQKAVEAGCDGYITKPIDTRTLGARIREYLDRKPATADVTSPETSPELAAIPAAELLSLRRRFLEEGRDHTRGWLVSLESDFKPDTAAGLVHQWIGAAGLLGYNAISRLARETEAVLRERPVDSGQLRETLTSLALAFTSPREARDAAVPKNIIEALKGKRAALIGLPPTSRERLGVVLERAEAIQEFFEIGQHPSADTLAGCDLIVMYVGIAQELSAILPSIPRNKPVIFVGERDDMLLLDPEVQRLARECLLDPWDVDDAMVRVSLALAKRPATSADQETPRAPHAASMGRPRVLIVDDDPTVRTLVEASLANFGMDCRSVTNGTVAMESIRSWNPKAAVLDLNMPGMDGYEVLAAIRKENLPVRVILLTARQQEDDIVRGFSMGADDYIVKPFSPMELISRLKRLLL